MKEKSKEAKDIDIGYHKGMPSNEHWQKDVSKSVFPQGMGNDPMGAFLPRPGKDRARPHVKINECDH